MAVTYQVTGITQTQRIGPTGNLVDYVEVTVQLSNPDGQFTIAVPFGPSWEQDAAAEIQAQIGKANTLLAL